MTWMGLQSNACIFPNECHCESDSVDPKGLCFHKDLNKSKSKTQLQIKTICGINWAGTNDWLSFTFCHSQQCCSTGDIQFTNGREDTANKQPVDCKIPDVFGSNMIGACKDFDFESESMVTGNVTYYTLDGADGWNGEWVKLILYDDASLLCPIYGWIAGHSSLPVYQDFSCSYRKYDNIRPTYGYELFFFESFPCLGQGIDNVKIDHALTFGMPKSFTKIDWVCVVLLGLKSNPQAGQVKMKISVHDQTM